MVLGRRPKNQPGDNDSEEKKETTKSRKPPNTAFRQQRLLAHSPILTPKTVLPIFFAIGIIFGPLGGLLLYASSKVRFPFPRYTTANRRDGARLTSLFLGPRGFHRLYPLRASRQHKQLHDDSK